MKLKRLENRWYKGNGLLLYHNNFTMCTTNTESRCAHVTCQMDTTLYFYFQGKYIAECIDEIKQELRQENQAVKANAVNKLLYVRKCKPYQKNVKCETNMNM